MVLIPCKLFRLRQNRASFLPNASLHCRRSRYWRRSRLAHPAISLPPRRDSTLQQRREVLRISRPSSQHQQYREPGRGRHSLGPWMTLLTRLPFHPVLHKAHHHFRTTSPTISLLGPHQPQDRPLRIPRDQSSVSVFPIPLSLSKTPRVLVIASQMRPSS